MVAELDQSQLTDLEKFYGITNAVGHVEQAMGNYSSVLTPDRKIVVLGMLSKLMTEVIEA